MALSTLGHILSLERRQEVGFVRCTVPITRTDIILPPTDGILGDNLYKRQAIDVISIVLEVNQDG